MTNKELEMVIEIKEAELAGLKTKLEGCEGTGGLGTA